MDLVELKRAGELRDVSGLERALRRIVEGEVHFDSAARGLYATDGSNYRQVPIGVVVPRHIEDVVRAVETARRYGVPLLSRGNGTSLAGQCCNSAVILDFSRHVRGVLSVDPDRRLARALPGTILDDLRAAAMQHGLTFGPDPSTHGSCTLGGMIGNNSCGTHAVQAEFFGPGARTSDNVEELEILTYDGHRMRVGPTSPEELDRIVMEGGRSGEIHARLEKFVKRHGDLIRARYPRIPRAVSGYNLPALLPENGCNVAQALTGSEGTLVTVLEATLKLIPALPKRAMLVIGYDSVFASGDAIPKIRELCPVGCEGVDDLLVRYMKEKELHTDDIALLPEGKGWLFIEFGADTQEEATEQAKRAARELAGSCDRDRMKIVTDPDQQQRLWEVREAGLGATAFVPGHEDVWPGWEDAAVPPDAVGSYLRDFRRLLGEYGYHASVYGHFAQGCIHSRVSFELTSQEGVQKYAAFTRDAADLVVGYGGSISGEHGDGQARGDLLGRMFGDELVGALEEFKAIWDPEGRMNPGKVVDASPRTENLRLGADYHPWEPETHFSFAEDQGRFSRAALRCVGVAKCRRQTGGTMCPSYMATQQEMHTTRGRARLLFEMVQGDVVRDRWQSEEVKEALDLCLACKGCKSDCPVNVDMATYKAEFMSHYYEGRWRPRAAYALGFIHWWARLAAWVPRLVNALIRLPGVHLLAKWLADVAAERDIPRFAPRTFLRSHRQLERVPSRGSNGSLRALEPPRSLASGSHTEEPRGTAEERRGAAEERPSRVLLWTDTFNNHFFPEVLEDASRVLQQAGCQVVVPRRVLCCSRPLYDFGLLDLAKKKWREVLQELAREIDAGTPVVGLEPSCVAAFRDELPGLFPGDELAQRLSRQVFTFAEFIMDHCQGWSPPRFERRALVQWHCHHRAVMGVAPDERLLQSMGVEASEPNSGCCGMAGAFGFERGPKHRVSLEVAERELLPGLRDAPEDVLVIADGFSCREQLRQLAGRRPLHIAQVVAMALDARRDL